MALTRLGHYQGTPDDTWDSLTGAAIEAWYAVAGYEAEGPTETQLVEIQGARERVSAAIDAVAAATKSLNDAKRGPAQSVILAQKSAVTASEERLAAAESSAVVEAEAYAEAVAVADADLLEAEETLAEAETRLAKATDENIHPDTGLPPTPEELAVLAQEVADAQVVAEDAQRTLAQAEQTRDISEQEQTALIRQSRDDLAINKAQLAELLAAPDTSFEREFLNSARKGRSDAESDLARLLIDYGTWLPAGQVVLLDFMPVRVDRLAVARGDMVTGSFMTVSGSDLTITTSVPERDSASVLEGLVVLIEDPINATDIEAVIVRKGLRAGTNGVAADRVYVELESADIPPELVGANVKITIPLSTTGGEVLAVPAAALSADADGSVRVEIDNLDGTTRFVRVEPGLSTGGLVEITPIEGTVAPGDLVVVGYAPDG